MRISTALTACWTCLLTATTALAIPPGQPIRSYKSTATIGRSNVGATPSFSPMRQAPVMSPGLPMGATGSAVSPWLNPGSVVGGSGGYYPSQPNRPWPGHHPNYRPDYGRYPEYVPPGYRPPGYRPPGYYPGGHIPVVLPYYSKLHYHWKPTCWTRPYWPVYYNYGYTTFGTWMTIGGGR